MCVCLFVCLCEWLILKIRIRIEIKQKKKKTQGQHHLDLWIAYVSACITFSFHAVASRQFYQYHFTPIQWFLFFFCAVRSILLNVCAEYYALSIEQEFLTSSQSNFKHNRNSIEAFFFPVAINFVSLFIPSVNTKLIIRKR